MGVSHVCMSCGNDLSRIRAVPDAHYGLAVVRCGRCQTASVRTKPEAVVIWKSVRRMMQSWLALGLQVAIAGGFIGITMAFGRAFDRLIDRDFERLPIEFFVVFFGVSFLSGGWLFGTMGHWRRRWLLPVAWTGVLVGVAGMMLLVQGAETVFDPPRYLVRNSSMTVEQLNALTLERLQDDVRDAVPYGVSGLALGVLSYAGWPLGLGVRWLYGRLRVSQLGRIRRGRRSLRENR